MDERRLDDIVRRLDDIERYLERHSAWHQDDYERRDGCGCRCHERYHEHHHHAHHHDEHHHDEHGHHEGGDRRHDDGFEEKRVVDLIVRLVGEKVEELLERHEQRRQAQAGPAAGGSSAQPTGSGEG